jgi:hypothetical protein
MLSDSGTESLDSSPSPDDGSFHLDPRQGREVGSSRIRGSSKRLSNLPYFTSSPSSSSSLLPDVNPDILQGDTMSGLSRRVTAQGVPSEPSIFGEGQVGFQMDQMRSQARFGQPSFPPVQPTFGQSGFAQVASQAQSRFGHVSQGISASPTNLPTAFQSAGSEFASFAPHISQSGERPRFNQGGNISIPRPTPRPGVEYIYEPGGLPSARRVAVSLDQVPPTQVNISTNSSQPQDTGPSRGSGSSSSSGHGSGREGEDRGTPHARRSHDPKGKGRAG